ncbi:hypothetical protein BDV3_001161 [Batrachochytrium dendrobatidis]
MLRVWKYTTYSNQPLTASWILNKEQALTSHRAHHSVRAFSSSSCLTDNRNDQNLRKPSRWNSNDQSTSWTDFTRSLDASKDTEQSKNMDYPKTGLASIKTLHNSSKLPSIQLSNQPSTSFPMPKFSSSNVNYVSNISSQPSQVPDASKPKPLLSSDKRVGLYPGKSIDVSKWSKPIASNTSFKNESKSQTFPFQSKESGAWRKPQWNPQNNSTYSKNTTSGQLRPAQDNGRVPEPSNRFPKSGQFNNGSFQSNGPQDRQNSFKNDSNSYWPRNVLNKSDMLNESKGSQQRPNQTSGNPKPQQQESSNLSDLNYTSIPILDIHDNDDDFDNKSSRGYSKSGKNDRDKERRQRELDRRERERIQQLERSNQKKKLTTKNILLPEGITIANLGTLMEVKYEKLARRMIKMGFEETEANYVLTAENAGLIVMEYGMNPVMVELEKVQLSARPEPVDWTQYPLRPPVVTIMGHVDHGKTTLLDSLRKTSVAASEAGGITQHIGAFSVVLPSSQRITFLDTPGHAAFSAMRERGAQITDIVVLVVAADDGVMPQTVEAIKHSVAAKVPVIVALNKCDKPGVNMKKTKEDLLRYELVLEEYGGEIPAVEVSGLTGKGLDSLEETILTVSEVLDIRGDPSGACEAIIIESKLSREQGNVATVLVRRGTLKPGAVLVAGSTWCKVRRLVDEKGVELSEAGPSTPISVTGWKALPNAGDEVLEAENEISAKKVIQSRIRHKQQLQNVQLIESMNEKRSQDRVDRIETKENGKDKKRHTQVETKNSIDPNAIPELRLVIKADVHGSLEALEGVIQGLPNHEVQVTAISSGVGAVTDTDVSMALAANAQIIAFNVVCDRRVLSEAKSKAINIHQHQIIYKLIDDLKLQMSELLPVTILKEVVGEVNVLQVFSISAKNKKTDSIAGCKVINGKVLRGNNIRVMRDGQEIYAGMIKTFKHHKKDIIEALKGLECGIAIDGFTDYQEGDVLQAYKVTEVKRTLS